MAKAVELYRKSAHGGDAAGQRYLAYCYKHGIGVEKDMDKAVEWYSKAAQQGDVTEQIRLG